MPKGYPKDGSKNKGFAHNPKPPRGVGWGGSAKGEGNKKPFTKDQIATQDVIVAKQAEAQTAREVAKAHAVAMQELMIKIANDPTVTAQTRVDAMEKVISRAEGKPTQSVDMTTAGRPLGYVIPAPPEAESAEEWTKKHAPSS